MRGRSWPAAVLVAVLLAAGCSSTSGAGAESDEPAPEFAPSAADPDPSRRIEGVVTEVFQGGYHVRADQRVAYTFSPPIGGAHDAAWAACGGVVYPRPVRSETLVHSLEHGAVWIAYDPERITGEGVDALAARVDGRPYTVMSPYPGLEAPISLQAWGHQLTVSDPADARIDQFIAALRANPNTAPEPGASCAPLGPGLFDPDAPPPFAPVPAASAIDGVTVVAERESGRAGG
jgi:hypothetical protein